MYCIACCIYIVCKFVQLYIINILYCIVLVQGYGARSNSKVI